MPSDRNRRPVSRAQVLPQAPGIADPSTSRAVAQLEQRIADLERRLMKLEAAP